jgi:hypothetical protein
MNASEKRSAPLRGAEHYNQIDPSANVRKTLDTTRLWVRSTGSVYADRSRVALFSSAPFSEPGIEVRRSSTCIVDEENTERSTSTLISADQENFSEVEIGDFKTK